MTKIILHADDFGRSPNISKSIYICIKKKIVGSISIIVSEKIHGIKYLNKTKVNKRLHLNLTDFSQNYSKKNKIYNYSFLYLLFMPIFSNYKNEKKKFIKKF